jgi:hypothetical protein
MIGFLLMNLVTAEQCDARGDEKNSGAGFKIILHAYLFLQ